MIGVFTMPESESTRPRYEKPTGRYMAGTRKTEDIRSKHPVGEHCVSHRNDKEKSGYVQCPTLGVPLTLRQDSRSGIRKPMSAAGSGS